MDGLTGTNLVLFLYERVAMEAFCTQESCVKSFMCVVKVHGVNLGMSSRLTG